MKATKVPHDLCFIVQLIVDCCKQKCCCTDIASGGIYMSKILYIFISGYYETYRENIYRTLSLPIGMVNKYIFDYDARVTPVINELNDWKKNGVADIEALIVFLDRSRDYDFYPVRKARYALNITTNNEKKVELYLKLGEYIYPRDSQSTSAAIKGFSGIPKRDPSAPTDDGPYISFQDSILPNNNPETMFYFGDEAWKTAVKELNSKHAFHTAPRRTIEDTGQEVDYQKNYPIFFRVKCREKQKNEDAAPTDIFPQYGESEDEKKITSYLRLRSGKTLILNVECFFPDGEDITSLKPKIVIRSKSEEVTSTSISEEGSSESGIFGELEYKVTKEAQTLSVGIDCRNSGDKQIICPSIAIEVRPTNTRIAKNFGILVCAAIYLVSGFLKTGGDSIAEVGLLTFVQQNWADLLHDAVRLGMVVAITGLNDGKKLF